MPCPHGKQFPSVCKECGGATFIALMVDANSVVLNVTGLNCVVMDLQFAKNLS
jgi:hypothetical protein